MEGEGLLFMFLIQQTTDRIRSQVLGLISYVENTHHSFS